MINEKDAGFFTDIQCTKAVQPIQPRMSRKQCRIKQEYAHLTGSSILTLTVTALDICEIIINTINITFWSNMCKSKEK